MKNHCSQIRDDNLGPNDWYFLGHAQLEIRGIAKPGGKERE